MHINGFRVGNDSPICLIIGPCVLESYDLAATIAEKIASLSLKNNRLFIFKGSYQKANRTEGSSFRGPGLEAGLKILERIKTEFELPILTDVHETIQVSQAAEIADILQIPAFLSRQTDLIERVATSGKTILIKKGQFMAPNDAVSAAKKAEVLTKDSVLLCERGTSFGYNDVVVDPRSIVAIRNAGYPIVFDASHTAQWRLDIGTEESNAVHLTLPLAKAAIAIGVAGVFIESHPCPTQALSDKRSQYPLEKLPTLVSEVACLDSMIKSRIV